jgi:phage terminase large subunit-like protein
VTGHTLNLSLHPAQLSVFSSRARFTMLAAGRRFGKSRLAIVRAITRALSPSNAKRQPCWIIAPTHPQAKQIYWQPLVDELSPIIKRVNSNEGLIWLHDGLQIAVKGADRPDSLRGVGLYDVVLDELADMKPETWDSIIRPALTDSKGSALFIGTPKGRNHFFDLYQRACGGMLPHREIAPAVGDWQAAHFFTADNPFLDHAEIEQARNTLPSAVFRQEYEASFEAGAAGNFRREWIKYSEDEPKDGQWYIAVDLAGFATESNTARSHLRMRDFTAIAVVKVTDKGDWWVKDVHLGQWGVEETAGRIAQVVADTKPTAWGIEKGALFNAVVPYLAAVGERMRVSMHPAPLRHENKTKNERIMWALQGRFEHGRITFRPAPWNKVIEDQLLHFPSKLVKDDGIESLAYIAQLAPDNVFAGYDPADDKPYANPYDAMGI